MVAGLIANFKLYACLVFGLIVGWIVFQNHRLESKNAELCQTIAQIKVVGEQAAADAKRKEREHARTIEELRARYDADLVALRADNDRLRKSRPSSSSALPGTSTGADGAPILACFDRAEFVAATDGLLAEISPIAERGDEDALRLRFALDYIREVIK